MQPPLYDVQDATPAPSLKMSPLTRKQRPSAEDIDDAREKLRDIIDERFTTMTEAFRQIDKDKSGKLSASEVTRVMSDRWKLTDTEVAALQEVIRVGDKDGDGMIDYHEFTSTLVSRSQQEATMFRTEDGEAPKAGSSQVTWAARTKDGRRVERHVTQRDLLAHVEKLKTAEDSPELTGAPLPALTPRETSEGLRVPQPPPREAQFASDAGQATPRRRPRYGSKTSLQLPSMLLMSSDPQRQMSERSNTPRAPPNDQVRPPPRPKFLNPKRLSAEMQAHLAGLVYENGNGHAQGEPQPEREYSHHPLRKENTPHGLHGTPIREHPTNQKPYVTPEGADKHGARTEFPTALQDKFAWSSERIAHELVCKFDQFTRRREDHMQKLLWACAADPNFEVTRNATNCRITPGNFPRICNRFGLICDEQKSAEIFKHHNIPTDGSCDMYQLSKNLLDTRKDTAQMMRESQNAIFGKPSPRPVTPRRNTDPYKLAKLPEVTWTEFSEAKDKPLLPPRARALARRESTNLW